MARITFPRTVGFGAGLLALVLIVFSIFGLLWGLWRPEMTATAVEGGGFAVDTTSNAQFQGFGAFVLATALLAGAVAFGVFKYVKSRRGLATMLYLALLTVLGSLAFWLVGGFIAPTMPDVTAEVGSQVSWVPSFNPGLGLAAAPFVCLLVYWSGLYLTIEISSAAEEATSAAPTEVGQPLY
ncbi:hypothetical protein [Corynebacterium sp.]|uniref:hypothetical protein n=1 Tax=Corynebacterium sp. TaxID=1720 RepID=UPI0026487C0F|nr:hypothetical protein [Corynebacterium sp.]MDN6136443.1 hypothetical protein [Corynebacterium sp.]MDN6736598.1 hypothetical protein [Corynebacterium sp.]